MKSIRSYEKERTVKLSNKITLLLGLLIISVILLAFVVAVYYMISAFIEIMQIEKERSFNIITYSYAIVYFIGFAIWCLLINSLFTYKYRNDKVKRVKIKKSTFLLKIALILALTAFQYFMINLVGTEDFFSSLSNFTYYAAVFLIGIAILWLLIDLFLINKKKNQEKENYQN